MIVISSIFDCFRDDTPHIYNDTFLNTKVVRDIIFNLTDVIEEFFPNITCYSALGNHDWSPKSQLPPQNAPLYSDLAQRWESWLQTNEALNSFRQGSSFFL